MNVEVATKEILTEWKSLASSPGHYPGPLLSASSGSPLGSVCSSPEMLYPNAHQEIKALAFGSAERKGAARASKSKMSTKRRMKASEREKMRMRSLAEALHQLRDYLPPDYSKRGQPLTKIQTLKYTIEYINKLSDILSRAQWTQSGHFYAKE